MSIENNIRFEAAISMPSKSKAQSFDAREGLVASFHNRNVGKSAVMVSKIVVGDPIVQHQGLYKASMNKGTSLVNWDDITGNKQKIAEYKQRMLGEK